MKKITVITGVCGVVGSAILDNLSKTYDVTGSGDRCIIGIDNLVCGQKSRISKHIGKPYFYFYNQEWCEWLPYNAQIFESMGKVLGEIDEIYHMAFDPKNKNDAQDTKDLVNWAAHAGVKRLVIGSSSEIYGSVRDEFIDEDSDCVIHLGSDLQKQYIYASLVMKESYAKLRAQEFERLCCVRFDNLYGDDLQSNHFLSYLINSIVRREDFSVRRLPSMMSFLHNSDAAEACVEIMAKGSNGSSYNVTSPQSVSGEILINKIIQKLSRSDKTYEEWDWRSHMHIDLFKKPEVSDRVLCTRDLNKDVGAIYTVLLQDGLSPLISQARKNYKEELELAKNS